jgi:hypothetical protein
MVKKFQDQERFTDADVDAAIRRNDPAELPLVPVTIALLAAELAQAQDACLKLSMHENPNVRGNALACLGHLARRFRRLDEQRVKPVIEASLRDADEYVRVLAKSAADEIHQFLGWRIDGHVYG